MKAKIPLIMLVFLISFGNLVAGKAAVLIKKSELTIKSEKLLSEKKYDELTILLWKNIEQLDRNLMIILANTHEKKKEYSEMARVSTLMIAKNEKDFQAYTIKGRANMGLKNEKIALELFRKANEFNSKYKPAYEGLAEIYENRKNLYELRILFEDMIKELGPNIEFLSRLCEINALDGTNLQALEVCDKAIALDPSVASNYVNKGIVYKQQGSTEQAEKSLKNAAEKFPKSALAQSSLAAYLEEQKNFIEAYKYYNLAANIDNKNTKYLVGLAKSAVEIRNYEMALKAVTKLCALSRKMSSQVHSIVAGAIRNNKDSSDGAILEKMRKLDESCSQ